MSETDFAPEVRHLEPDPRSVDDARQQISDTRHRISETLDAIELRIVDTKQEIRRRADVLRPVRDRIRLDPWKALAIGAGAGLALGLLTGGSDPGDRPRRRHRSPRAHARDRNAHYASDRDESVLARGRERLEDAGEALLHRLQHGEQRAREWGREQLAEARDWGRDHLEDARDRLQEGEERARDWSRDQLEDARDRLHEGEDRARHWGREQLAQSRDRFEGSGRRPRGESRRSVRRTVLESVLKALADAVTEGLQQRMRRGATA